jgi:hypothetical protein
MARQLVTISVTRRTRARRGADVIRLPSEDVRQASRRPVKGGKEESSWAVGEREARQDERMSWPSRWGIGRRLKKARARERETVYLKRTMS